MAEKKQRNLGEILIEKGVVTEEQVAQAAALQAEKPEVKIGEALVKIGAANWDQVYEGLAELLGYKFIDLRSVRIAAEAVDAMPKAIARKHNLVPIGEEDGALVVAITDPFDLYAMDNLRFYLGREVRCVLASPDAVAEAINKYYGIEESTVDNMLAEFTESDLGLDTSAEAKEVEEDGEDSAMVRLVQLLVMEAVKLRASDIHIEPMKTKLRVRYRVDGNCQEMDSPPKKLQGPIISRVKILAGIDIAERRRPTDGRISMRVGGVGFDIRVSALPGTHGESVVMRLLMKESVLINLQELGFHESDYRRFESIIKRPNGIFLVTGPTGSGKTTTLYAALHELNRPDKKIITAEHPVEYNLSGINQCEVKERIGLTFGRILRSMLRQAPNIILVGEIRDTETAEIATQAALTGHLVFSTLHTNDAPSSITRLIDMGIKPFLVASSIQAIMAQRLIRRLCTGCKQPTMQYDRKALASVGLKPEDVKNVQFYQGMGCERCRGKGFRGRVAVFELMEMDTTLREMAFRRESVSEIRKHARSIGMATLREDGVRKVINGLTTIPEVLEISAQDLEQEEVAPAAAGGG
jgi:type IV pilus assembly protein PilB